MFTVNEAVDRPRRGHPDDTRKRLIRGAAEVFNTYGYAGTDVRRIVAATGYATGTFYRHFPHKGAALLAAYESWVIDEWNAYGHALRVPGSPEQRAQRIVDTSIEQHARWHGLRQALVSYMQINDDAARKYRELQRHQLDTLRALRTEISPTSTRPPEADVLLVMLIERAAEGIAAGEWNELGLSEASMRQLLIHTVANALDAD